MKKAIIFKRRESATAILIVTIVILLFWIPQSSSLVYDKDAGEEVLQIYKIARLLLFPSIVLLILLNKAKLWITRASVLEYMTIAGIFFLNIFLNHKINFVLIWMVFCLFAFDYMAEAHINIELAKKLLNIAFYFLLFYFLIFKGKAGRRAGSWLDPNIAGFFYFLFFYYLSKLGKKFQAALTLIMGIMTFSRLFLLVLLVYFFSNIGITKRILSKIKIRTLLYCLLSLIGLYLLSKIYVKYFTENYVFGYSNSISRLNLSGLIDESNYFRCYSNMVYFLYLNAGRFLFGYDKSFYKSVQTIRTPILPHNLILSLLVNFGVVVTIIYLLKIRRIHNTYQKWDFFLPVLIYYTFLGTSSYYGFEIMLQLLIMKIIEAEKGKIENER